MSENTSKKLNWFQRLKGGLKKSSDKITQEIKSLLLHKKLDEPTLQELEDLLIMADLGVETARTLISSLRKNRFDQEIDEQEIRHFLATEITRLLDPFTKPLPMNAAFRPYVILMVGVNGSGKTTTIGKIGYQLKQQGLKVRLVAADTFRAAAVEQLREWGNRSGLPVEYQESGSDPASLVYDAYLKSRQAQDDVLLIDTAGRLHTKENLMAELSKMRRVLQKVDPNAPHECVLVLDAVLGQNAHSQVNIFQQATPLTGLILTKLDGTAKGGVVVALAHKFKLPLYAVGVGEGIDDLKDFKATDFARNLMGFETYL